MPIRAWRVFAALILAAFVLRGIALACIIPPFEMWDEYQHVGYIQYLIENHHLPIYGQAAVPRAVVAAAICFPQGPSAMRQLGGSGAMGYPAFWAHFPARHALNPAAGELPLYEALHPPLYYWLAMPIFRAAGGVEHPQRAVAVLRLVNVAAVAVGLAVLLEWLGTACRDRREAMLIALWPALQPLFLLNAMRVSNDALAVLLGIAAVVALLRWMTIRNASVRRMMAGGAGIGLLLGLGVLAKATDFALLPFAGVCILVMAARRQASGRALLAGAATLLVAAAAISGWDYAFNVRHYHMLVPMQQAFVNRDHHIGWRDELAWLTHHPWRLWPGLWYRWLVTDGLWFGGWSFLHPWENWPRMYAIGFVAAAPGWTLAWLFRRERLDSANPEAVFVEPAVVPMALVLTAIVFAGLSVHALEALIAWGGDGTWPWYAAAATPWLLMVVAAGAIGWRRSRLGYGVGLIVPLACVAAEWSGAGWQMVHVYAQLPPGLAALRRLALLQPPWLGTGTLLTCAAVAAGLSFGLIIGCTVSLWGAYQQKRATPAPALLDPPG